MTAKNKSNFLNRHVGLNNSDIKKMINHINIEKLYELIKKLIQKSKL